MQIPSRLCFLFHSNGRTAHTAAEVLLDGKWAFHDVSYGVRVALPDGSLAEARQLSGEFRPLAHEIYRTPLHAWRQEGLDPNTGGDLLNEIGICNYLIDGVEAVDER